MRQQLQELKSKAEQKIADIKTGFLGLGGGANRGALQDQIDNYRDEINSLTNSINALESKIERSLKQTANKSTPIIDNVKSKYKTLLIPVDSELNETNK